MNQQFYDKLKSIFPFVAECSIECGDGWSELIWNMCVEIDDAYLNSGSETEITILQCKEKFGSLLVHYSEPELNAVGFLDSIIEKYERLSEHTCEICGAEGRMVKDDYWIRVRCEWCL